MKPRRAPTAPMTTRLANLNVPRSSTSRSRVRGTESDVRAYGGGQPAGEKLGPQLAEGRVNPMSIPCVTWVGTWRTDDRVTWRTADAAWLAELERSNSGRHVSLAIYNHGVYQGRQDASGFHLPTRESRSRR